MLDLRDENLPLSALSPGKRGTSRSGCWLVRRLEKIKASRSIGAMTINGSRLPEPVRQSFQR